MLRLLLGDRICHASMLIAFSMWLFMNLKEHVLSSSDLSWGNRPPNPGDLGETPRKIHHGQHSVVVMCWERRVSHIWIVAGKF